RSEHEYLPHESQENCMQITHYDEMYGSFREQMRRFAKEKVAPYAAQVDEEGRPPMEAYEASLALGLPGLPFAEEFGGQEGDVLSQIITVEELARVCASTATTVSTCWIMMLVQRFG